MIESKNNQEKSRTDLLEKEEGHKEKSNTKVRVENNGNNQMELEALLVAIRMAKKQECEVIIYTDSAYARNCILDWAHNWSKNGWLTSKKQPVLNKELIEKIYNLYYEDFLNTRVKIERVAGHSGIVGNELVDALSKNDMNKFNNIIEKNNIKLIK